MGKIHETEQQYQIHDERITEHDERRLKSGNQSVIKGHQIIRLFISRELRRLGL